MPRKPRVRSEQQFIEGTAPEKNEVVHRAAKRYVKERDARIAANKAEKEAHDYLLDKMIEEGLDSYEYGDLKVFVDNKRKCKVTTESGASANGEAEGGES
jgi:hypothetical protein